MFFVLKFELILIIGPNNVLTEGARKVYRGRRVGQGCVRGYMLQHLKPAGWSALWQKKKKKKIKHFLRSHASDPIN
jgi:hypothetical protein